MTQTDGLPARTAWIALLTWAWLCLFIPLSLFGLLLRWRDYFPAQVRSA